MAYSAPRRLLCHASSARSSDPEWGRLKSIEKTDKRMKAGSRWDAPSWRDSAMDYDEPCLYFVADATRQRKGVVVVEMFTTFSWVWILLNYMYPIKLC